MIDTETTETLAIEDVYTELEDGRAMNALAGGMAIKFHRQFPLIDGLILACKGRDIITDLGQGDINLGRRLIVYREEPIMHPQTGIQVGIDNEILDRARVTQVMPGTSKAELAGGKKDAPKRLDRVITQ